MGQQDVTAVEWCVETIWTITVAVKVTMINTINKTIPLFLVMYTYI